jgi:hypothetical protein
MILRSEQNEDPIKELEAIGQWADESGRDHGDDDPSKTTTLDMVCCGTCGQVCGVTKTHRGPVECVKCGEVIDRSFD